MRSRKHVIHQKFNSNLKIEFAKQNISSFSGLELFIRYFRLIALNRRIRRAFVQTQGIGGDYSVVDCVLIFIALWLTGGNRLRHVRYISEDPLVKRLCGLRKLPSERTLGRWLAQFTNDSLQALVTLNSELVIEKLQSIGLATITLDFDGTVLSCGKKVGWAFRGYNPHKRYAPSYYPFLCHIAQTGHFLQVKNRPGNVHDSTGGSLEMIKQCVQCIRTHLPGVRIEVRMDSAFFQQKVIHYLEKNRIEYAIKVPMWPNLHLKDKIKARKRWFYTSRKRLVWFKDTVDIDKWDRKLELLFFREKISDTPHNHQLDFFTPDDGLYKYNVILSNKRLQPKNTFDFYNGRAAMEHQISELKGEFAFESVPTRHYQGNSCHQHLSVLAYNLVRNFQIDTNLSQPRKRTARRTNVFEFDSLKTLRFEWINIAGRIVNPSGTKTLRLAHNQVVQTKYQRILGKPDQKRAA